MKKSVLIIKLGYCETLVNEEGSVSSLGDVFRHTVLLHHYSDYDVTWLTSESTSPLLAGNEYIHELMIFDENTAEILSKRRYDEVLCLEKLPFLCDLARTVKAGNHRGFGAGNNGARAHPGAESALAIANGKDHFLPIQALLFQMVGDYWAGEDYILGYDSGVEIKYDVGLNFRVGSKWPSKTWPKENWQELAKMLSDHGLNVSWQEGDKDLAEYMDWIHSCRAIVTCDSLGMHLGLAMKKKVIALFGPTPSEQIYMYGRGVILTADWACPDAPCMRSECVRDSLCMSQIFPKVVARTTVNLINGEASRRKFRVADAHELKMAS